MSSPKCSICAHPAKGAVDLWWRLDVPRRRIAEMFEVGEATLRRHADHADGGRDHALEAQKLVDRAWESGSVRQLVRAEAGLRSALRLDMTDFGRSRVQLHPPSPHDVEILMDSLERAWKLYEAQTSLTGAAEALSGIRSALRASREAKASGDDLVDIDFTDPAGELLATAPGSLVAFWAAHRVPPEYRDRAFTVGVQMQLVRSSDLSISFGDKVLFTREGK